MGWIRNIKSFSFASRKEPSPSRVTAREFLAAVVNDSSVSIERRITVAIALLNDKDEG